MKRLIVYMIVTVLIITSSFALAQAAPQVQPTLQEKWDKIVAEAIILYLPFPIGECMSEINLLMFAVEYL